MRLRLTLVLFFQTLVNAQQRECKEVENVFKSITDCVTSIASPKSSFRVTTGRPHSGRGQTVNFEDRGYLLKVTSMLVTDVGDQMCW